MSLRSPDTDGEDDDEDDDESSDSAGDDEDDNITEPVFTDSDDETSEDESESGAIEVKQCPPPVLIAAAPEVMEPSHLIQRIPGLPYQSLHCGFRICGDNIDKTVRRRHMRSDRGNISLHYFHSIAVENRVHFSMLSDSRPDNSGVSNFRRVARSIQPTLSDDTVMRRNFATLVSRVLTKRMPFFKACFKDLIVWHIEHRYSHEMSQKSVVVSYLHVQNPLFVAAGSIHLISIFSKIHENDYRGAINSLFVSK